MPGLYPLLDQRPDAIMRFTLQLEREGAKAEAELDAALASWWHTRIAPTARWVQQQTGSEQAAREILERAVARVHAAAAALEQGASDIGLDQEPQS